MDKMLKDDVTRHAPVAEVQSQLAAAGYKVEGQLPKLKATGPTHTVIVYSTSLWVELTFNEDGTMSGFHLDRQG